MEYKWRIAAFADIFFILLFRDIVPYMFPAYPFSAGIPVNEDITLPRKMH